ncbi:MAG: protoporphyrinogen oxidase [Rikenellaceae bacterium]
MLDKYDVILIGGGITALTTALHLVKGGQKVAIVEKNDRLGGQIRSFSKNGFIYESGPNTGVINAVEVVELFKLLGLSCEVAKDDSKNRLILYKGKFLALPSSLFGGVKTPFFSFKDKFRVLFEPFRSRGKDENESLGDFASRRLGKTIVDYAVDPFISGIYAGDPYKLVARFAMPKLYNLEKEYGSFIVGTIKRRKIAKEQRDLGVTKDVFSAVGGLESVTKTIVKSIGEKVDIFCSAQQCKIEKTENGCFDVSFEVNHEKINITSDRVVTTVGAYALKDLLPQVEERLLERITSLEYAKVAEVALGYNTFPIDLKAFGGLIPSKENRKILGILFPSACFEGRAPKGGALLSVFLGGVKKGDLLSLTDAEIEELVLSEIKSTMGVDQKPDLIEIFRHSNAIPQYYASSEERLKAVDEIESRFEGLMIGGNLKEGIGLSDRIKQGRRIALDILSKK